MFTRLEKTYEPLRAQIAAGVLRTHGISAWVAGDVSSSNYGTIASGGCSLMVAEADVEEARRILEAHPLPEEPASGGEAPAPRKPFSLGAGIGHGIVQGAVWLPVLALLLYLLLLVLAVVFRATGIRDGFAIFAHGVPRGLFSLMLAGALLGLIGGLAAWLLSNYRHRGKAGVAFVMLVVLLLVTPELLFLLLR